MNKLQMIDPLPRTPAAPILLWLAGNGLRLTILAVPPVMAMIRDQSGQEADAMSTVRVTGKVKPAH